MLPRPALLLVLAALVCPPRALAQAVPEFDGATPAHVSFVDGTAMLERDGRAETSPLNMPLVAGDRLKTADGRVEVLFGDGSALHLDSHTTIDLQADDLLRLIEGRLRFSVGGLDGRNRTTRTAAYRVDSPAGSVRITQPGEYRLSLLDGREPQLELAVLRGAADIFTDQGSTAVRAGERAYASAALLPSYPYTYNSANWDAFDRWSESRRATRLGISTQYLPEDVRPYASTLDEYGDWRYQASYGYVWYPRVAAGWRPYYYGRWAPYPRYGWTWIGVDAFSWPTHHYGRWGFSSGVWFWIPAAHWAPAYVSWAYAPGYVSWCPLGFDNRPVIGVNVFHVGPGYYSSARAWTAVAYSHFGYADYVHRRAVDWNSFDRAVPRFQIGSAAPAYRGLAAGTRGAATLRGGSGAQSPAMNVAQPRGASTDVRTRAGSVSTAPAPGTSAAPRYVNRGDTIVRSQTERPTPARGTAAERAGAAAAPQASPQDRYGVSRAAPRGPARLTDGAAGAAPVAATIYGQPPAQRAEPRAYGRTPDSPAYQPRAYEPGGMPQYATPRPGTYDARGSYDSRAPRQAAPQPAPPPAADRGAPAPPAASAPPGSSAPGREHAVPRDGGRGPAGPASASAPARRGRGGL